MSKHVPKKDHPPRQQPVTSGIPGQITPSPEEMTVQPEMTRPPTALSTADQNPNDTQAVVPEVVTIITSPPEENAVDAFDRQRRTAVLGQTSQGPEPGSKLDQMRRRSFGMPNRITLDAETASLAGSIRNLNMLNKPLRPIQIDDNQGGHLSAFHHSMAHFVIEKASQEEKSSAPGTNVSSKTSVIDAFLGTKWTAVSHPKTAWSAESLEDPSEEVKRRCNPRSLLFYPHYAADMVVRLLKKHTTAVHWLMFVLWAAYVIYAVVYNFHMKKKKYDWCSDGGLISWTSVVILLHLIIFRVIMPHAHHIKRMQDQIHVDVRAFFIRIFSRRYVRILSAVLIAVLIVLVTQVGHMMPSDKQMIALCGYFVIILMAYLLSVEPEEIRWGMVAKNLLLQVLVVYLMMVWTMGRLMLACIASKISFLFRFSSEAAEVLFSHELGPMLSIELLSSLTLTGTIMHLLYYTGMLQGFLHKTGIILELITGTTTVEAISGLLCTLFGGIETSVILEPYIVLLTMSELHTFITSSIASMTGVALAMTMQMGVDKITLMTVNFATFNGVLAISKVIYPETDASVTTYRDLKFLDRDEYNMIDAGVRGAIAVLRLLAQLIAVLIAFIAMINMGNEFVEWLLYNIGIPKMDVVAILSLILRPLIFLMGIEWQDTRRIASYFATKTVKNEHFGFKAYVKDAKASSMKKLECAGVRECSVTVALLYGFTNFAHMGATIAYLTAVAPERRHDISFTVPRAMLTAMLTNLLTAALVGALVSDIPQSVSHATPGNMSNASDVGFIRGMNASGVTLP